MPPTIADLDTPAIIIDIERVEANLRRAQDHADAMGIKMRPHIKTHKLPSLAHRQIEIGAIGITVQKLGEAEIMADAGIADIFLPYNIVGAAKLARLKALHARIALKVTADSPDCVAGYAMTFADSETPLIVLVECDTGMGRCGVQTPAQALALARHIAQSPGLVFGGLMTYPAAGKPEQAEAWLAEAVALLAQAGIACPEVSSGGTPDMWRDVSSVITEQRLGTYIYNDRYQVSVGAADWDHCALTVLATVVSRPTATRIVIDAGSKTLSSDVSKQVGYGLVMGTDWTVASLSEEHGVIELQAPSDAPRIGERLRIIPNHVCPVSNLADAVHFISGESVLETVPVAARGKTG